MIEVNELRVGNWIDTVGLEQQVEQIYAASVFLKDGDERICLQLWPIKLTVELLAKFNFDVYSEEARYKGNEYFVLNLSKTGIYLENGESMNLGIEIKHVHQLQNLFFAITDKDLPIEL